MKNAVSTLNMCRNLVYMIYTSKQLKSAGTLNMSEHYKKTFTVTLCMLGNMIYVVSVASAQSDLKAIESDETLFVFYRIF